MGQSTGVQTIGKGIVQAWLRIEVLQDVLQIYHSIKTFLVFNLGTARSDKCLHCLCCLGLSLLRWQVVEPQFHPKSTGSGSGCLTLLDIAWHCWALLAIAGLAREASFRRFSMFLFRISQPKLLCFSWAYDPELFWAVLRIGSVLLDWFSANQEGSQENRRSQTIYCHLRSDQRHYGRHTGWGPDKGHQAGSSMKSLRV